MTDATVSQRRLRHFVTELKCYWCAAVAGALEGSWPLVPGLVTGRR